MVFPKSYQNASDVDKGTFPSSFLVSYVATHARSTYCLSEHIFVHISLPLSLAARSAQHGVCQTRRLCEGGE